MGKNTCAGPGCGGENRQSRGNVTRSRVPVSWAKGKTCCLVLVWIILETVLILVFQIMFALEKIQFNHAVVPNHL